MRSKGVRSLEDGLRAFFSGHPVFSVFDAGREEVDEVLGGEDRDRAPLLVEDREVPEVAHCQAVDDLGQVAGRGSGLRIADHQLTHWTVRRGRVFVRDQGEDVAFGEESREPALAVDHHDGADILSFMMPKASRTVVSSETVTAAAGSRSATVSS